MHKKKNKILGLTLFFIIVSSCSLVGEWWYERLDKIIANYFYEYAEFDRKQKDEIKRISQAYHNWLSKEELPKYRSLLIELRDLDETTTNEDIANISAMAEERFIASNNFFHPFIIEFSIKMTDKQVSQIDQHFREIVNKRKEAEKKRGKEENSTLETFIRVFKFLKVELNEEQKNKIIQFALENDEINRDPNFSEFDQAQWNKELNLILLDRKNISFEPRLDKHLKVFNDPRGESELNKRFNILLAEIISSMDVKQRKNYRQRINFFIRSLEGIIDNYI